MKTSRLFPLAILTLPLLLGEVRVGQDSLLLPTYEETLPDPSPHFYVYNPAEPSVYPYTMRTGFTKRRVDHAWRALRLENEYLMCIVLPDLGGHLYSCKDKLNGQEMFHANPSVKKAAVGLRGAWVAMGIEMNFPDGHTWVAVSPVDFATVNNPDGSASIWVGNIDRVYEMQWRVEFVLRPGSAFLEQNVYLENRTGIRHRYYWWNNGSVLRVDDKTRFIYPMYLTGTHKLTEIDTWPVNSAGVDMSVVGNHKGQGVALFAHGCREPFMAVYHPTLRTGTVHYADARQLPGKKIWSWGREGNKFVATELSDDNKSYVEEQAGVFENQETYGFLEPGEERKFSEYWMPVRGLGGVSRANLEGVVNLARSTDAGGRIQLTVEFNANHKIPGARLRVTDGTATVMEESASLDPAVTFSRAVKGLPAQMHYTFQLLDSSGKVVLSHTEDQYDALSAKEVKIGPQPSHVPAIDDSKTAAQFLKLGEYNELQGLPGLARSNYQDGLERFPGDLELSRAMGRLAVSENRFEEAEAALSRVLTQAPADVEAHYYLGVSHASLGEDAKGRKELESVGAQQPLHTAANVALAGLLARAHDLASALGLIEKVLVSRPDMTRAGAIEVALLRRLGQTEKARQQLAHFRSLDPTDATLRYEQGKLGQPDALLWPHLAADPERVLNVAIDYIELGFYEEALDLLSRKYPSPPDIMATEPGAVLPQHYPLAGYYRAYCMLQLGRPASKELEDASGYFTEYVFPNRPSTFRVLRAALQQNPSDATALFLLGSAYMGSGQADKAIDAWQQARKLGFKRAELFRELGRALLILKKDAKAAASIYQQGLQIAPTDPELQRGLEALFVPAPKSASPGGAAVTSDSSSGNKREFGSPKEAAAYALGLAAQGKLADAANVFDAVNFPGEKQEEDVREAYIQIQAQGLLVLARARKCTEAIAAEDVIGNEDPKLPFTFHGFGAILKGPRFQYYFATVEALCGNDRNARKLWSKLAKLTGKDVSDVDFSVPFVAAAMLGPEEAKPRIEAALEQVNRALTAGRAERSTLLYSRGMLLRALGREKDAQSSLAEVLGANPRPIVGYLALTALRR
jgi:tetratricopeptide (TPR) repeat protein